MPTSNHSNRTWIFSSLSLRTIFVICCLISVFAPYICSLLSRRSPYTLLLIILFFTPLSPSPPLCPVLSLSHSSLSPADSAEVSVYRDHMTISPIGSPPPPMSSYRLAPFPAKSRPAGAALAALRRPSGRAVHNAAPLLLHAGLDLP